MRADGVYGGFILMAFKDLVGTPRATVSPYVRRKTVDFLWNRNGCDWAWKVFKGYRGLCYHSVGPEKGLFDQGEKLSISAEDFEQHLLFLNKHYDVISLEELVSRKAKGISTDHCLAITFDDGYQSLFDYGVPLLEKHKMPCTVFLSTAFLDNQEMSWPLKVNYLNNIGAADVYKRIASEETNINADEIGGNIVRHAVRTFSKERTPEIISKAFVALNIDEDAVCKEAGLYVSSDFVRNLKSRFVAFGNHTHTHPLMGALTADEQRAEMETSHRILREDLGLTGFLPFAFPFGGPDRDFSQESVHIVKDFGYDCICAASIKFRAGEKMGCVNRLGMPTDAFDEKAVFGRLCRIM